MSSGKIEVSVFQKAKKGNYYCGDSYFYKETESEFVCVIADGLGSGELAKESSQIVIDIIEENNHATVEQLVKLCTRELFGKRGAVVGILKLHFETQMYSFSSIGNIGVITVKKDNKKKRNIPNGGYLAGYQQPFKVVREKMDPKMNFIMFSDGVSDRELSEKYFINKDVQTVTRTFEHVSDETRMDDTTLIAIRYEG
ncbi:negative regulator of sigma-B (phosphoserine phosphatase) [Virgibacillus natechei]|uniref:Negative regulator of sigma-B (Phosphoserine phosphatase) n=1 Tax=Virgibacillus natechei TaxID=1216297 RepID=A0ABS4IKI5_9BACI|nr:SpoIIE family protein phosphatase [Virgibacillus natechei]MBP1971470.1 negative regulator of sigma-B (phosphoserine phosphatase) [Virgibacillus natechei]UZD13838.1 SpoIIE family protein phosphatase [Virgibacillus natechei]